MKNFVKAHFLPRRQAIVKMNGTGKIELCRRKAKKIMSTCKKYHSIFPPFFRVENPCGKTCGECGKVRVFNSYPVTLPTGRPWFFHAYGAVYAPDPLVTRRLCCRGKGILFPPTLAKKLAVLKIGSVFSGSERATARNFCEFSTNRCPYENLPAGNTEGSLCKFRRLPCRVK